MVIRKGFESLQAARQWILELEQAYNKKHLHTGINFITPASCHRCEDSATSVNLSTNHLILS